MIDAGDRRPSEAKVTSVAATAEVTARGPFDPAGPGRFDV